MNLKEKLDRTRRWWKTVPEKQKGYLWMVWIHFSAAVVFLIFFLLFASSLNGPITFSTDGILQLFLIAFGCILFATFGVFAVLWYAYYLELRIKQLEEEMRNE